MIRFFTKDLIKYIPSKIIPSFIAIITIPIITRLFSPSEYGNYILIISTASILLNIGSWTGSSIIRYYPEFIKKKRTNEFISTITFLMILSLILVVFTSFLIFYFIEKNITNDIYPYIYLSIPFLFFNIIFLTYTQVLRIDRKINFYSTLLILRAAFAPIIGIYLVIYHGFNIDGLLYGMIISFIIVDIPLVLYILKDNLPKIKLFSLSLSKKIFIYSFPLVLSPLAVWILSLSDRYLIEFFLTSNEVGIYSIGYKIPEAIILLISTLIYVSSRPLEMKNWEELGPEKSKIFIRKLTRYFIIIMIPAVIGVSLLAKPLIYLFSSASYYEGYVIIPIVCLGIFFLGFQHRYQTGLLYFEKTRVILLIFIIGALLNIIGNIIFIPIYSYIAAAYTTLFSYFIVFLLMYFYSRKYFKWKFPISSLFKVTLSSIIMAVVITLLNYWLKFSYVYILIISIVIGMIVYFSTLYILKEFTPNEKKEIFKIFRRFKKS